MVGIAGVAKDFARIPRIFVTAAAWADNERTPRIFLVSSDDDSLCNQPPNLKRAPAPVSL